MPYRASDEKAEGVVITYEDVTERRGTAEALNAAKRQAELASVAKSRFLAAASHDLRQPLQTLALLQGLLAKNVVGAKAQKLVVGIDEALGAMTGMLNTLLDINQIEVGVVKPDIAAVRMNEIFDRLREELTYHAQAAGLTLRVVPCTLSIQSDRRLLEQMIRNLISNALKYTHSGKVLVGCRSRQDKLSIEIWDTGIGIPKSELKAIFEEYHQVDNAARQRSRGLGLGLSIVKSLGELLGHRISVRSLHGKGSVFSIEVPLTPSGAASAPDARSPLVDGVPVQTAQRAGAILIIEDDPEVREHLKLFLNEEGYRVTTAVDGPTALEAMALRATPPDLVLADYNLPNGMNGVQVSHRLRRELDGQIPFIILTGDISTETLRDIALYDCVHLNKPVKLGELTSAIDKLLARPRGPAVAPAHRATDAPSASGGARIIVVDDDDLVRKSIRAVLEDDGRVVDAYSSCEAFLEGFHPDQPACLLIDAYLPGMSGLELLDRLRDEGHLLPAIMITGNADVPMAVRAMKAGALDFIEKPIGRQELIAGIERALDLAHDSGKLTEWRETATAHLAGLTPRQQDVMERVLAGHPSKNIAADLGISQRTVENHRAAIMKKTGSKRSPHWPAWRFSPRAAQRSRDRRAKAAGASITRRECDRMPRAGNPVADELGCGQDRRRKDRAGDAPQPKPEDEGEDHENRIEGKSFREKHRRGGLALHHMDAQIERRRKQRLPGRGDCQRAGEEENEKSRGGPENRNIVENESDRSPQDGIADPGRPHHERGRDADKPVNQGDCEEIRGDVAADLLRDVDRLPLAGEPGQDLDEPPQETVPRHKQEVEKHHRREQAAGEAWRAGKERSTESLRRPKARASFAAGPQRRNCWRPPETFEAYGAGRQENSAAPRCGNALGQLGYPRLGGSGNGRAKSDNRRDHDKNEHNGSQRRRHTQSLKRAQRRLHQKN